MRQGSDCASEADVATVKTPADRTNATANDART
jgi:hypothetical protein